MKPPKHQEGNNSQSKNKPGKTLPKAKETNILSKEGGGNNPRMEGVVQAPEEELYTSSERDKKNRVWD
ncbi:hypothetical protein PRUPE_5G081700 [Prunus persica]|uniref:Uncharacterized protein n=1 Tax=Prunus persica TaxID=3760 RepID=A0A251P5D7_PRUPE|nr:hypothetical protein PRUPE_5G081700 [Prunus persica]